ncbi:unnamed protein product [Camellia sinensis]
MVVSGIGDGEGDPRPRPGPAPARCHSYMSQVTSRKDQEQYWIDKTRPYTFISVTELANRFKRFHVGLRLANELSVLYNKAQTHQAALVYKKYTVPKRELLKASFDKEWLLIKRNSFFYVFKTVQIIIVAIIASTVFLWTKMHTRNEEDGAVYVGALLFTMIINMFNGFAELSFTIQRLPVFYKQRDILFHPPSAFTLPTFLLRVPISVVESIVWTVLSYYTIGFAPEVSRFFKQLLVVFFIQQMAIGIFRLITGACRTVIIANTDQIPSWWSWGYWVSPLIYGFNSLPVNEMFAPRWMNKLATDNETALGVAVLNNFNVFPKRMWFWIGGATAILGPPGKPQAIISKETVGEMEADQEETKETPRLRTNRSKIDSVPRSLYAAYGNNSREMAIWRMSSRCNANGLSRNEDSILDAARGVAPKRGMVLPFTPLAMSFDSVKYFVDMPPEMKEQGVTEDRLQLLREVTGAFRPGVLTALMGVSGARKTILMDVLAGRKTGGYIKGEIRIFGFPKIQETFARIFGYCEQTDIHSPQVTIRESLIYSAFLRLPKEVSKEEKMVFVDEVMDLVELDNLKDAIVGLPGVIGLSTEQRKRLTIAVELVANPLIIFMDKPTSSLDARAAAIVMRTVRNTVDTGRTVVCTIHQPSIGIFEAFDELLLMKRGGQVIYSGPLGRNSRKIIEYFEEIPGIPKIKEKYNPATWMLEASSVAAEVQLGIDFAEHYKSSSLHQFKLIHGYEQTKQSSSERVECTSTRNKRPLFHITIFSAQFGAIPILPMEAVVDLLEKPRLQPREDVLHLSCGPYGWNNFLAGWQKKDNTGDLSTIIGAMYAAVLFVGINNCQTVQPVVAIERTVFYREKAAGMYSALPYAMVITELPFVLVQTVFFSLIVYSMVGFKWAVHEFFWFFFITYISFLYFTYYGMMTVSITQNHQVASILAAAFYALFNLFSGFFIPRPKIPKWWMWYYWICSVAWTVYGLIASQYGDVTDPITVPGMKNSTTVQWYMKNHFGYEPNFIGPVAGVLVGFAVFFAFMYAYCIKTLNFQMR